MKIKAAIIALSLLLPQPTQAGLWDWLAEQKAAIWCALGIGACVIAYKTYQRSYTAQGILNRHFDQIESKLNKENFALTKRYWESVQKEIEFDVYINPYSNSKIIKPAFDPFKDTIEKLLEFVRKMQEQGFFTIWNLGNRKSEFLKIRHSMNQRNQQ